MKLSFTVTNKFEAWEKVNELFPTDYAKDENSSQNAGYSVYRSTVKSEEGAYQYYYCYICDLGSSLEITITDHEWNATTILFSFYQFFITFFNGIYIVSYPLQSGKNKLI